MVVQWIYTFNVIIPRGSQSSPGPAAISLILSFLILADEFDLLGNTFICVAKRLKDCIKADRLSLQAQHIHLAAKLLSGHPLLRKLFARACVPSYIRYLWFGTNDSSPAEFRFEKELDEVEGFAHDLLKALQEAIRAREYDSDSDNDSDPYYTIDEITGKAYIPYLICLSEKNSEMGELRRSWIE